MINATNSIKKITGSLCVSALCKLLSLYKVSFIVGSYCMFFSLSNGVLPLIGAFAGLPGIIAVGVGGLCLRIALFPLLSLKVLAMYVPGMVASLAWIEQYKAVRYVVPLVCMGLFIAHPVGGAAWLYTLYWLIPVTLYALKLEGVFAQAVTSTLMAHAVGSTLWIYADPMTPIVWLGLIPVVAIERCIFACGMAIAYTTARFVMGQLKKQASRLSLGLLKDEHGHITI